MSMEPMLWALKDSPTADTTERLILVAMGEKADSDGCNAYPSKKTMARAGLCDEKTVQRKLRAMESRKLIALGDQSAARRIPRHVRPKVYDLLIPCSWYGQERLARVNEEREQRGLPPLTPKTRPSIAPAPEKKRRSDLGKKRPEKRGDPQSPLQEGERRDGEGD
ncbi:helix-turn-helix domain-containing protein [Streptomyces sp. NPDC055287]